jgi:hypothetical protein
MAPALIRASEHVVEAEFVVPPDQIVRKEVVINPASYTLNRAGSLRATAPTTARAFSSRVRVCTR